VQQGSGSQLHPEISGTLAWFAGEIRVRTFAGSLFLEDAQ